MLKCSNCADSVVTHPIKLPKSSKIFLLPFPLTHCRCEGFRQFRDSANIVIENVLIGVRRQLLKMPTKSGLLQLSQGYSHCEIVVDLWSAPSFVCLTK